MNIQIIDDVTGKPTTLCLSVRVNRQDPLGPQPGSFSCNEERALQEDEVIRGLQKVFNDRMNKSTKIAFESATEYASNSAAESAVLTWPRTVPNFGTVVFKTDAQGGSTTWYLVKAGIKSVRCKNQGVTVMTTYDIEGGAISTNLQGT